MATYYFRNTGDVNWGTATNWSLTDGGGATGAVPTAADDAYFTSNSGNCTVNASARVCKTLIFAGVGAGDYTGTVTMTFGITVSGNVTLSATMGNFLGAGNLTINATSTYDSNTKTFPNTLILTGTITVTLAENATVGGLTSQTNTVTLNSNTLSITGALTINATLTGTSTIKFTGTNTWSASIAVFMRCPLVIDTASTLTLSSSVWFGGSTATFIQGTLNSGAFSIVIGSGFNSTITTNSNNWGNLYLAQTTLTLSDNCNIKNLTIDGASVINSNNLNINGNITMTSGSLTGSTTAIIIDNCDWTSNIAIYFGLKLTINNPTKTLKFLSAAFYNGSTLIYTSGAINTQTFNWVFIGTISITSNSVNWGNWYTGNPTITLVDNAICNNLTTEAGAGSATFNSNNLDIRGDLLLNRNVAGTSTLTINGTGNQAWSNGVGIGITNNLFINKPTGNLTPTGSINYGSASSTLTYNTGSITGTATWQIVAGTTYNINSLGFTLWNWSPLTGTHTIQGSNGLITVNNNLTFNGNTTFAGTGGWTVANISDTTAGRTLTLKDGSTYTITTAMTLTGTNASPFVVASSSATLRAILTLNYGASQTVQFVTATRIDSSAGQTIWDTLGTGAVLTNTLNWNNGARPAPFNSIKMG